MRASLLAGALASALWGVAAWAQAQPAQRSPAGAPGTPLEGEQVADDQANRQPARSSIEVYPADSSRVEVYPADRSRVEVRPQYSSSAIVDTGNTPATQPSAAQPNVQPASAVEPVYVDQDKDKMRGLTVMAGGGVEGYTGDLASQLNPGPGWGVTAAIKPTKVLGIEIGYSGAVNNLKGNAVIGLQGRGADIVRNGVDARATVALSATPVQPYVMGGFGISRYSVREDLKYQSDTSERVPVGGGIRSHFGQFTADARFAYNFLINEGFASAVNPDNVAGVSSVKAGAYQGLIQLGATF